MVRRYGILAIVLVLVVLGMAPGAIAKKGGDDRPFKGEVVGEAFFGSNPLGCVAGFTTITDAAGPVSHMGKSTAHLEHCFTPFGVEDTLLVITAANGDELWGTYAAVSSEPIPDIGETFESTFEVTFTGGTGRFSDAAGWADLTAFITFEGFDDLMWPWAATWSGELSY